MGFCDNFVELFCLPLGNSMLCRLCNMSKSSRVNLVIFIFEVKVFVWSLLANPVGKLRQHITDMSSYYSFLNLAFMVAHGSFYKQDVPDRKCGKVSADINPAFFFNHLAATNITGFSETLSLAKNSLSLVKNSLS